MNIEEREINLKLMFAYIIKQWRKILIATLIFGLLGTGYKFAKVMGSYTALSDKYTQDVASFETNSTELNDQKTKAEATIEQLTNYSENSLKAAIDPYTETRTTVSISIVTANGHDDFNALLSGTNYANKITQAYASYINSEVNYSNVAKILNTDEQFVEELVATEKDFNTGTVNITVIGSTENQTVEIMKSILSQVTNHESVIHTLYGDYTSIISTPSTTVVKDESLIAEAKTNTQMLSANAVMNDALNKITSLKATVETINKTKLAMPTPVNTTIRISVIKYLMLGLAVGLFGSIFLLGILFAKSGKVYEENDLKLVHEDNVLTVLPASKDEKKKTKFDRYLNKITDSAYNISETAALEKAAANITACREDAKKILLVCGNSQQELESLMQKLQNVSKDTVYLCTADVNADATSLAKLKEADGIILVAKRNVTKLSELSSALETSAKWHKKVIGSIVI